MYPASIIQLRMALAGLGFTDTLFKRETGISSHYFNLAMSGKKRGEKIRKKITDYFLERGFVFGDKGKSIDILESERVVVRATPNSKNPPNPNSPTPPFRILFVPKKRMRQMSWSMTITGINFIRARVSRCRICHASLDCFAALAMTT